ncbi:MAG: SIR2 family protein [Pyrinomonadaceae bacterium]
MKPVIPDALVGHVAQQNSIAFIGAGLSAGLGLPGWPQLIRQMIDWCESQGISLPDKADIEYLLDDKKDLLAAANALRAKMGDDKYRQFLSEVFLRPDLKPTEVHDILAKIPFVAAATTNYDSLIEDGYRNVHPGQSFEVFAHDDHEQLGTALNAKKYFVLKAHGTVERPETIILDSKDYDRLFFKSEGYRTFLRAMFLHRTVLFLGFSMTDPELLFLLRELKAIFDGHTPTHYALVEVSQTRQIEWEQFEEQHGVKIIPYIRSADDHPEVKSFLDELSEKVTQNAIWYQIEEARKAAKDDDPNYQVVFTTDGEFILKERYPGAAEKHPLTHTLTVKGEGKKAIERMLETGEPLDIKAEDIVDVIVPDIIRRYIKITGHLGISSGVGRGDMKRTVKATIECADGETASLDNIILEEIQGGNKQAILSNEKQDVPWKFRLVILADEEGQPLQYTFNDVGLPVKQALDGLRFSRALAKGGFFRFEDVKTGEQFAHADIEIGTMPAPEPLLIRILEALDVIHKKTRVRFTSPEGVPEEMVNNIFVVQQIVETGSVEFQPPYRQGATVQQAKETIEIFSKAGVTGAFTQYATEWVFNVLGQPVQLGPVLVTCEKWHITPEDLEVLKNAVESSPPDAVLEIRMTPVDGAKVEAKVPNWLPVEEREKVYNHPHARRTVLNQLIPVLFETAQTTDGALDVKAFMALLNEAKGETSEQGVPLNPLDTITPEELTMVLEPVIAGSKPDEKLKLAVSLYKEGWLQSGEAARLGGVDEATFMNEQNKREMSDKARGVGSDS